MRLGLVSAAAMVLCGTLYGQENHLAGNTVLIVRHAEKPETGRELTAAGEARARAYASYFEPFHEGDVTVKVDALYAGADSEGSVRPRLTLEPLSRATGLALNTSVGTKEPEKLVSLLKGEAHPAHPLIAWRHGQIPALLAAFGARGDLIPGGKWPDATYDWVVVLRFDETGKLVEQKVVKEGLVVK